MMAACAPSTPEPIPLDDAQSMYDSLLPQLQEAVLLDEEATWTDGDDRTRRDDGVCRWSAGDSSADIALDEDDTEAWDARREAVNAVLEDTDFDEVGEAGRRDGAPAFGFFSERGDGAGVHLYTASGTTVIRVFGVPVETSACA